YEEASRRAASLMQDIVQCLILLVMEKISSEGVVTIQREETISAIPENDHNLRKSNSLPRTSSVCGRHMASIQTPPCPAPSRQDMTQSW
ncbi:hypothetical protein XENOCAPTIV_026274, partial [Xenoophorus captivus]